MLRSSNPDHIIIECGDEQAYIKDICHRTLSIVTNLIENKVVNKHLTVCNRDNYFSEYQNHYQRVHGNQSTAAKHWLMLPAVIFLTVCDLVQNEKPNYILISILSTMFFALLKKYEKYFGSIPYQNIGTKYFLNDTSHEACERERKFDITYLQAKNASFHNPLRLFSTNFLDKALQAREIEHHEYDAILRCFFGIKNKSFDCVSVSALVMLVLLENQLPASISRISSLSPSITSHHYVLVNYSGNKILSNIDTWSDDVILIDGWYGVCKTGREIKADKDFLNKYPLLNPKGKIAITTISGKSPTQCYLQAVAKMVELCEQFAETECFPSHLDMIYPRI